MVRWFYSISGKAEGPVSEEQIRTMLKEKQLRLTDLVYCEGDDRWRTVAEMTQLSKAMKEKNDPPPPVSGEATWVVLKKVSGQKVSPYQQMGPYTLSEIRNFLSTGHFQYSDYVWKAGFSRWLRIGSIADFDRRSDTRGGEEEIRQVPVPSTDEPEEMDLSAVTRSDILQNVEHLKRDPVLPEEEKAPEDADGLDILNQKTVVFVPSVTKVSAPPGGIAQGPPLRKNKNDDDDDDILGAKTVVAVRAEPRPPDLREEVTQIGKPRLNSAPKKFVPVAQLNPRWIAASVSVLFVLGCVGYWLVKQREAPTPVSSQRVEPIKQITQEDPVSSQPADDPNLLAKSEPGELASQVKPEQARRPMEPPPATPPASKPVAAQSTQGLPPSDRTRILNLTVTKETTQPTLVFETDAPIGEKINVTIRGRTGEVLEVPSFTKQISVVRSASEAPIIELKPYGLPQGRYSVEAVSGGAQTNQTFTYVPDRSLFLGQMEKHLKQISFQQMSEKRALFYSTRQVETLAKKLGVQIQQNKMNLKKWKSSYAVWRKDLKAVEDKFINSMRSSARKSLAYPDEFLNFRSTVRRLREQGVVLDTFVQQKRDLAVASKSQQDIVRDIGKFKDQLAQISGRRADLFK